MSTTHVSMSYPDRPPGAMPRRVDDRRSIPEILVWVFGFILAVVVAVVWCLMHLPSASVGASGGLTITNKGLPVSNATIFAQFADGRSVNIPAGRIPRGETVVPIPPGFPQAKLTTVSIDGDIFGLGIASHTALSFD
jgi:hypothetical protein